MKSRRPARKGSRAVAGVVRHFMPPRPKGRHGTSWQYIEHFDSCRDSVGRKTRLQDDIAEVTEPEMRQAVSGCTACCCSTSEIYQNGPLTDWDSANSF